MLPLLCITMRRWLFTTSREQCWKIGAHAHPREITKVMELYRSHTDWDFIDTHEIKHHWNQQLAPLCLRIDSYCSSTDGYCTKMLNHLGACIRMMLKHHKDLVNGPCLTAFRKQLQGPCDYHKHKGDFKMYQRDSDVLSHIN